MQEFNVTKIELNHLLIGVNMKRRDVFPFTAIIGQDMMKLALELNVINPRLGGVLIQGERGLPNLLQSGLWRTSCLPESA